MKKVTFSLLHINDSFKILESNPSVGEIMPPHTSNKDAVFFVLVGKVAFLLGDEMSELHANDSIHIPKKTKHSFEVLEDGKCILILDSNAKIVFEQLE